jgi:hypothetical protein
MSQYDSLLSDQLDQFDAELDAGMHSPVLEKLAKYYKKSIRKKIRADREVFRNRSLVYTDNRRTPPVAGFRPKLELLRFIVQEFQDVYGQLRIVELSPAHGSEGLKDPCIELLRRTIDEVTEVTLIPQTKEDRERIIAMDLDPRFEVVTRFTQSASDDSIVISADPQHLADALATYNRCVETGIDTAVLVGIGLPPELKSSRKLWQQSIDGLLEQRDGCRATIIEIRGNRSRWEFVVASNQKSDNIVSMLPALELPQGTKMWCHPR